VLRTNRFKGLAVLPVFVSDRRLRCYVGECKWSQQTETLHTRDTGGSL
jgi:hypothetical protein